MSVRNILKAVGKKADDMLNVSSTMSKVDDVVGKSKKLKRLEGKHLESPYAFYQQVLPYRLNNKIAVPLAVSGVTVAGAPAIMNSANSSHFGNISAGEGLSNMTEGTINGVSANVITPYIKQLNSKSEDISTQITNSMQHNIGTGGAEGNIVFALHNMR